MSERSMRHTIPEVADLLAPVASRGRASRVGLTAPLARPPKRPAELSPGAFVQALTLVTARKAFRIIANIEPFQRKRPLRPELGEALHRVALRDAVEPAQLLLRPGEAAWLGAQVPAEQVRSSTNLLLATAR